MYITYIGEICGFVLNKFVFLKAYIVVVAETFMSEVFLSLRW